MGILRRRLDADLWSVLLDGRCRGTDPRQRSARRDLARTLHRKCAQRAGARAPGLARGRGRPQLGQDLLGLDLTHPGARAYLSSVFGRLREAGFDYFKLDFLFTGALDTARHEDLNAVGAYRSGLALIREAVGPGSYLLGCGAPMLPSVGLVDAMRVSPDTYHPADTEDDQRSLRGRACVVARAWQHGRFWVNDADCLVARPSFAGRREWAEVVERYSGLRSVSDRIAELDDWGMQTTRRLLATAPPPTPFPPGH